MTNSTEALIRFLNGDRSMLKCTLCGSPTCDCWTRCRCGWSFEKGAACKNPVHQEKEPRP